MQSASDVISSLFWFKDDSDVDDEKEQQIIEQFVHHVEDFSSQYGSEISVSYTAFNLRGPPSNFPDYGDYPQAFVMVKTGYIAIVLSVFYSIFCHGVCRLYNFRELNVIHAA